ncbi:MAG TPA: HAD-IA family hydrolase [Thermomicrobiales bacterium]|nr:HAD-IA family hydrolase [Thermomicrobiales bacterium]
MSKKVDRRPKAVIWDLDGTLIDSEEWHWLSWQEILHAEGYPITYEEFLKGFGRRNDEVLREYFGADADPARLLQIGEDKEARYRQYIEQHGIVLMPGVEDWLGYLGESGWLMGVATSAPNRNLNIILDVSGLALYFDAIVGKDDVTNGKPDPEVFLTAASRLEVPPVRSIVVEDVVAGIAGAHAAGMAAIGVGERHAELGADLSVPRLDELEDDAFETLLAAHSATES